MARPDETAAVVKRALAYPYETPERSFLFVDGQARELPPDFDLAGRTPVLAYGANSGLEALARKLATQPDNPLPVLRAELDGFEIVYSAHVTPYGGVPATFLRSPGSAVSVHVIHPDPEQLPLFVATEPNYERVRLTGISCRIDGGREVAEVEAFESRHGPLLLDGAPVALSAISASGRTLRAMPEPEVLELVRSHLEPDLSLEDFILLAVRSGGIVPLPGLDRGEAA